jgi:hypothetical protein
VTLKLLILLMVHSRVVDRGRVDDLQNDVDEKPAVGIEHTQMYIPPAILL